MSPELQAQLDLYILNYTRFMGEIIPMLNQETSPEQLMQIYETACHYARLFGELAQEESRFSPVYATMSLKLAETIRQLLGFPDRGEDR